MHNLLFLSRSTKKGEANVLNMKNNELINDKNGAGISLAGKVRNSVEPKQDESPIATQDTESSRR